MARRPSSVNFCANCFFSQANGRIATKLSQDGLRWACIQDVFKVKINIKGHVIWALLCWQENRFFSQANGPIATKLAHDGHQVNLHPGCARGQGQRSRDTGTFVLARKSLLLAGKWLDRDQPCTRWSPGKRTSRVCSKFRLMWKVMWYQHIWNFTNSTTQPFPNFSWMSIIVTYLLTFNFAVKSAFLRLRRP